MTQCFVKLMLCCVTENDGAVWVIYEQREREREREREGGSRVGGMRQTVTNPLIQSMAYLV